MLKRRRQLGFEQLESRRLLAPCPTGFSTLTNPLQLGTLSGDNNTFTNCPRFLQGDNASRYYKFTFSQDASTGDRAIASYTAGIFDAHVAMALLEVFSDGTVSGTAIDATRLSNGNNHQQVIEFSTVQGTLLAGTYLLRVNKPALLGNTSPFDLTINAPGLPPAPELVVSTGGDILVDGGALVDFGEVAQGEESVKRTFTIENTGTSILTVGNVSVRDVFDITESRFTVIDQPAPLVLPGGSTTFTLAMSTDSPGNNLYEFSFLNNDADEDPFTYPVFGVVHAADNEMEIRGNGLEISDGDASPSPADQTEFETLAVGSTVTQTYTIRNTGGAELALTGDPLVDLTDNESLAFRIVALPDATVAAGGETDFQIEFSPASSGEHQATVRIESDDSDESTYTFDIRGNASAAAQISGKVLRDDNGNGQEDPDDAGLAGVTLFLDTNDNTVLDDLEPVVETGADGSYAFMGLAGGRYTVRQVVPDQMLQSAPDVAMRQDLYYGFLFFTGANLDRITTLTPDGIVNPSIGLTQSDPDGKPVNALAYDSRDGILYGIKAATDELFQFDLQSGRGTLLGTLPAKVGFGLTYNPIDDRLYTFNLGELIRIDPVAMTAEVINDAGATVSATSLVYNPIDGLIYVHSSVTPRVQVYHGTTGNGPFIASDPNFEGTFAAAHNGNDIVFADADDPGDFVSYDSQTGSSAIVLSPNSDLTGLDGMAFVPAATSSGAWQVILAPGQSVTNRDFFALVAGPPWQNRAEVTDANNDSLTSPVDALIIINELNSPQFSLADGQLPERTDQHEFFYDINGDGFVSPVDALIVINFLNNPDGEGEAIREPVDVISFMRQTPSTPFPTPTRSHSVNDRPMPEVTIVTANSPKLSRNRASMRAADNSFRRSNATFVAPVNLHDLNESVVSPLEEILSDISDDLAGQWF